MLKRLENFIKLHERLLSYGGLVLGFIFDALFFRRVDLAFENIGIIVHFAVGLLAIALMHGRQSWYGRHYLLEKFRLFLPFVMQFAIGGLFGKFVIFYSKSGALVQSWPFLITLAVLFIGNESFRGRYEKLNFRLAIFFTALFTYAILLVPVITKEISARIFLLGGLISLVLMVIIVHTLHRFIENVPLGERQSVYVIIFTIYILFNVLYFTNIIPPIPLSLKESGIYHAVERTAEGNYLGLAEEENWRTRIALEPSVHFRRGEPIYAYSSIFAPTQISANIVHEWQLYDERLGAWLTKQKIELSIAGGRDNGYRTYSYRSLMQSGHWRVNVETLRGQLIGRLRFEVVEVTEQPKLLLKELP